MTQDTIETTAIAFIFEGFEQSNTTPVPDVLFDKLLSILSGSELKALLYIIRRTIGFKKTTDAISLNQFQHGIKTREGKVLDEGCGIKDRQTIVNALESLEAKGCIERVKGKTSNGDDDTTRYRIRFKGVVGKSNQGSREIQPPEVVGKSNHLPSRQTQRPVVGNTNQGSREIPTRVVGKPNPQETVFQYTDIQQTVIHDDAPSEVVVVEQCLSSSAIASSHAYISQSNKKSLEEKKTESPSRKTTQSTTPPEKKDAGPPPEPDMSGAWLAETVVQYAEYCNKRRYTDLQRRKEIEAARAIHRDDSTLTLEQFKQAYDQRNDAWWLERKGKLHVTDLKRDDRIHKMLDIVHVQKEKVPKKKATPKPWEVQTEKDFDRSSEAEERARTNAIAQSEKIRMMREKQKLAQGKGA